MNDMGYGPFNTICTFLNYSGRLYNEELKNYLELPDNIPESMKIMDIEDIDESITFRTIRDKMSAMQNQ